MPRNRVARRLLAALLCCSVWPVVGFAFANVATGDVLDNVELPTLDGRREALLSREALANVFIFFRPKQDHSLETLKQMAGCERDFEGKRVHWVAIVSSIWERDEVTKMVAESGIRMPVLIDQGDALYGKLGVRLHPVVGVADDKFKLLAYEPFHKINYCDRIRAKIQYALHEIDAAAVARSENPERADMPGDIKGALAKRHLKMGEGYFRTQQYDKAVTSAEKAIESEPGLAAAHALLGDAYAALGRCDEAGRAWDEAVKADPAQGSALEPKRAACAPR